MLEGEEPVRGFFLFVRVGRRGFGRGEERSQVEAVEGEVGSGGEFADGSGGFWYRCKWIRRLLLLLGSRPRSGRCAFTETLYLLPIRKDRESRKMSAQTHQQRGTWILTNHNWWHVVV